MSMTVLNDFEESIIYNQQLIKRLIKSITLSHGQFSLILVCCNYQSLQQKIIWQLKNLSLIKIKEIVLPKTVNTLYTTIDQQLESLSETAALMILNLEKVEAIDELLISTNQVRDEFRKKFSCPLVLWITEQLLTKLTRLAPDLKSWAAATIKFELATCDLIYLIQREIKDYWIYDSAYKQQKIPLLTNKNNQNIIISSYPVQHPYLYFNGFSKNKRQEIELAMRHLKNSEPDLEAILEANVELILGRDDYYNKKIDSAIDHYRQSLNLWRYKVKYQRELYQSESYSLQTINNRLLLTKQGIVLYNIALCYYLRYTQDPLSNCQELKQAKLTLQESKQLWEKVNCFELVATVIPVLGEVVKQMKAWGELEVIATEGLKIHYKYGNELQLAQDYGFLAEIYLQKSHWYQALKLSEKALNILFYTKDMTLPTEKNKYLLLRANIFKKIDREKDAIEALEIAEVTEKKAIQNSLKTQDSIEPKLYLEILAELRSLYYKQGKYIKAFRLKMTRRQIAHQYGLVAFIGASQLQPQKQVYLKDSLDYHQHLPEEITVSSRQKDVNNLLERISRDDHKLTIIHGPSGVGKSSLVNVGLVPALGNISIAARDTIPVVVQVYSDWLGTLANSLQRALQNKADFLPNNNLIKPENHTEYEQYTPNWLSINTNLQAEEAYQILPCLTDNLPVKESSIIAQLKNNAQRNLLTVIVFDQFEELYFTKTSQEREVFYRFMQDCLNLPFVKLILSMREDCLHYLLECDLLNYLDIVNNNILDKQIRYHLRDFSREDAYKIIECLTKRAKFNLEPELIHTIVDALADERQNIRPIELQVVGSQLQAEKPPITTLAQFQQHFGQNPKQAKRQLIKKSLEEVIEDCGQENEEATMQILYALTNENLARESRRHAELLEIIKQLKKEKSPVNYHLDNKNYKNQIDTGEEITNQLDLILEILLDSGLLFTKKEFREKRYQLIHDYLIKPIRKKFNLEDRLRQAENEIQQAEIAKKQAETDRITSQLRLNIVLKRQLAAAIIGIILMSISTIATLGLWQKTIIQNQLTTAERHRADINSMTAASEALFFSDDNFFALIESLRAAKEWEKNKQLLEKKYPSNDTEYRIAATLQQAFYGVKEYNQLEGHSDVVWNVIFHPEGNLIASASVDTTIKLWRHDGKLQKTLKGHTDSVSRIDFSSDGKYLASASHDRTVKIWNLQQTEIKPLSLNGHGDKVTTINFSPDDKILVSGSLDKTIKIWSKEGILIKTIKTKAAVYWANFSPDGRIIAAANANGTVELWNLNGQLLASLKDRNQENNNAVYAVDFAPDGRRFITANGDKTIKIWRLSRRNRAVLERTITGHQKQVLSASFSPDGQTIASSGEDNTIKIWDRDGTLLKTFSGHGDKVTQVSFSPNGQTLASASYDKTIKLWDLKSSSLNILQGHQHRVLGVSFSPDGQVLASASQDNTVKLWSRTGELINTLEGHTDRVASVSFSPDGQILASASYDKRIKLWYLNSPEKLSNLELFDDLRHYSQFCNFKRGQTKSDLFSQSEFKDYFRSEYSCWIRVGNFCLTLFHGVIPFFPTNFSLLPKWDLFRQDRSFEEKEYSSLLDINSSTKAEIATRLQCLLKYTGNVCTHWDRNASYYVPHDILKNIDLVGHTDSVMSVNFNPNSQIIASGSKDKTVKLWNRKGELLKTLVGHRGWVSSVSFSPNGKMLASASDDGTVKLWTETGTLLRTIDAHNNWVLGVSFSPDGKKIATASYDNTVKLWTTYGKLLKTFLNGASDSVTSVSFSPDGQVIASSSYDGKVKLWSLYDGTLLKTFRNHGDSVMTVSFSPDGRSLASGSRDKTVILWNLALDDLLDKSCSLVSDYLQTNPNVYDSERQFCLRWKGVGES